MTDLFVYDLNNNLISQNKVDFKVIPDDLVNSKIKCKEFLTKTFNIGFFDTADIKITLSRKFDEVDYSIILKISNKGVARELLLTNILKND